MFWENQDTNKFINWYKKLLGIHILKKPTWIDFIDRLFNPIMGKSIAFYFEKK